MTRQGLLIVLVLSVLLLYCLGGLSLWARRRFLGPVGGRPTATIVITATALPATPIPTSTTR